MRFANPWGFAFAALFVVLIALYLWERRRRRILVPSLLLWEAVPQAAVRGRRPVPDLLFVLQALVLGALVTSLANPYILGRILALSAGRHLFVMDLSASMKAREGEETRFAVARRRALEQLGRLGPDSEAMLVGAGIGTRIVVPATQDFAHVRDALQSLEPMDTRADLDVAIAIAERAAAAGDLPATIHVFTDLPRSTLDLERHPEVHLVQIGAVADNMAIDALQVFQARFQDHSDTQGRVVIRNFSARSMHTVLSLRLDSELLSQHGLTVPPRGSHAVLIHRFPRPGLLHAHIDTGDALAADDDAWAWVASNPPLRVLAVSPSAALHTTLERIGTSTRNLRFRTVLPADYVPGKSDLDYDVVLFHRFVPPREPAAPALYVYPPGSQPMPTISGEASEGSLLDWNERHPILANLRPLLAHPVGPLSLVELPPWAEMLLSSRVKGRDTPLAFAGTRNGRRVACISFDLEATDILSADNVALLLFTLSVLDWLAPADPPTQIVRTGETQALPIRSGQAVRVRDPEGNESILSGARPSFEPVQTGRYEIEIDGRRRELFANLLDPAESDIDRTPEEAPPPRATPNPVPLHERGTELGRWLAVAALVLFGIEWVAALQET